MLRILIAAIAIAAGFSLPHAPAGAPALTAHVHVTAFDTNGGGPPTHP
jgi:hypothetical protein